LRARLDLDAIADAACESSLGLDVGVFYEAGLVFTFYDSVGFGEGAIHIAAHDSSSGEHVLLAMGMDQDGSGSESCFDFGKRLEWFPFDRKRCEIEGLDCARLARNHGDGFATKAGFIFGEHRLVGEGRDHAVAVLAGNVSSGECSVNSGMLFDEGLEVAKLEASAVVRAADRAHGESADGDLICAVTFGAKDFALAIETNQAGADGASSVRRLAGRGLDRRVQHCGNNFAVSRATAKHAAEGIHDFGLGGLAIVFQKSGSSDEHSGDAGPALRGAVTKECLLNLVK
jgi:hypothetical protein